jgi:hypothetical protein
MSRGYSPGPNAICDASGFKVKHSDLVKQWDGAMVDRRFVDRCQHPQDFVRGVPDRSDLQFARPESPDVFVSPGDVQPEDL